jgi:hypothetical protein
MMVINFSGTSIERRFFLLTNNIIITTTTTTIITPTIINTISHGELFDASEFASLDMHEKLSDEILTLQTKKKINIKNK